MTMAETATAWGSPATWRELAGLGVPVAVPNSDGSWRVPIWTPVRGWELASWFGDDEIRMPAIDDGEDDEQRRGRVAAQTRAPAHRRRIREANSLCANLGPQTSLLALPTPLPREKGSWVPLPSAALAELRRLDDVARRSRRSE